MRGIFAHLLPWIIVFGIGFTAGDRYGAPEWMSGLADRAYAPVERTIGGSLGGLFERISRPIPNDDETEGDEGGEQSGQSAENDLEATEKATATLEDGLRENRDLKINDTGLQIIKDSEGLRLEPYSAGGYTYIGYGHQIQPGESFSSLTEAEAEALLRKDVEFFEDGVRALLTRPANENQFSAMVSLAYNKGLYGFKETNVLKRFNAGDIQGAADDFRNHTGRDGPVPHLVERRERERMLFLK